ncbi:MAG TPA: CARDB domain-containing protein [Gaiellaceae bacterium]|jgi:CARDB protein|nr:CARDB domain-containing protein [Gaiellaceae bacterium]
MSTRDDDILDFDFFDEEDAPAWQEPEGFDPQPPSGPGRGRRGSGFRPPRNLTPLLRLIGLIALAILVVVLLVVWVEGCTEDAKLDRNRTYLADIGSIGNASAKLGQQVSTLLTTPGLNEEDLDAKLGGYVQTAENQMQQAEDLNAPGPMVVPNAGAVEALRYRVNGLRGLQAAFKESTDETDATVAGEQLLAQTRRLLASDIIWSDSFQEPAEVVLQDEGIEGLDVPSSEFVTTDDLVSQSSLAAIWQRIQGASTGGTPTGLHGSGIAYVKALPSGQLLSTTTETTIKVTDELKFEVGVEDTGESQEVRIKVTLTIPKQPDPIVKTATIPIIDAGETKAVVFTVGALVPFGEQTSVKVDVDPVPGETNTTNNTAEYPVIFTL